MNEFDMDHEVLALEMARNYLKNRFKKGVPMKLAKNGAGIKPLGHNLFYPEIWDQKNWSWYVEKRGVFSHLLKSEVNF